VGCSGGGAGESGDAWGAAGERGGRAWRKMTWAAGGRRRWRCRAAVTRGPVAQCVRFETI
jgi:hypothetical protein